MLSSASGRWGRNPCPGVQVQGVASGSTEPFGSDEGARAMGDKSPHNSTTKKAPVKSIKEKRLEKKSKTDHTSQMDNLTHHKKG
jgi:hypothetical protein